MTTRGSVRDPSPRVPAGLFRPDALARALRASVAHHRRLCPRQVLGARIALLAGRELGLRIPRRDRRLVVIVETDGCFVDGVAGAAGCSIGGGTLRLEDYGKVAASFVDTETGRSVRISARPEARELARRYAPGANDRWEAQLTAYQRMPDRLLLSSRPIRLVAPLEELIGEARARTRCQGCGDEVIDRREVVRAGRALCRPCAGHSYYVPALEAPAPGPRGGRRGTTAGRRQASAGAGTRPARSATRARRARG